VLENKGRAEARELKIMLDGQPLEEHSMFFRNMTVAAMIGPGGRLMYPLDVTMESPDTVSITIDWNDDSGTPGKWESQLNIYA